MSKKSKTIGQLLRSILLLMASARDVFCRSQSNTKLTYANLFGTEQFLFVGLSKCHLTAELSPPPSTCPYHSIFHTSESQNHCPELRMHLILRDNEVPKVLIFGATKTYGNMVAQQFPIPWPKRKPTASYMFEKKRVDLESSYYYVGGTLLWEQVVATLFDSKLLYVLRNITAGEGTFTLECVTFYMQPMPDGRLIFHQLNILRNIHPSNNDRLLWTEDPYNRKFYYAEKRADRKIVLHSVPFDNIMQTLVEGKPGTAVQAFHGSDFRYLSVSRGVAIIYAYEAGKIKQFINNLAGSLVTIVCNGTNPSGQLDPSTAMFVLFDEEFCSLQEVNGGKCKTEEGVDKQSQNTMHASFYWLIAFIVITLALAMWLVYFYRRRNVMETTFTKANRSQIHYYPPFTPETSFDY